MRNARPAKKTKDELDAEMADYFDGSNGNAENATGGAPTAATNGDAPRRPSKLLSTNWYSVNYFFTRFYNLWRDDSSPSSLHASLVFDRVSIS